MSADTPDTVIKVGGALGREGDGALLRSFCAALVDVSGRHRVLVVPGGGSFADLVRAETERYGLSESAAHWMAVLGMDAYGQVLLDLLGPHADGDPAGEAVLSPRAAGSAWLRSRIPVLLPYRLVRREDPLPHGWEVTSDAIAAWVAVLTKAKRLVLVKPGESAADAPPIDGYLLSRLASPRTKRAGFAGLAHGLPESWAINGTAPHRLSELLDRGSTEGLRLV